MPEPTSLSGSGLRVAIVVPHAVAATPSGERVRTSSLASALASLGVDVTVVGPLFPSDDDHTGLPRGQIVTFRVGGQSAIGRARWRGGLAARRLCDPFAIFRGGEFDRALKATLTYLQPDVVDFQHTFLWRDLDLPTICTVHNIESTSSARRLGPIGSRLVQRRESRAIASANAVVSFSSLDRQRCLDLLRGSDRPVNVVALGTEGTNRQIAVRTPLQRLIYTGTFDYLPNRRAAHWLYQWMSSRAEGCSPITVTIAGRQANSLPHPPRGIQILSDVEDMTSLLLQADALVVPLDQGAGVRVKIIEALAVGLPVVSTALGCEGLGLRNNENALIVSALDGLPAAIDKLQDRSVRERLSRRGFDFWKKNFSSSSMASGMLAIYRDVQRGGQDTQQAGTQ